MSSASIVTLVSSSPFHQPSGCWQRQQVLDAPARARPSVVRRARPHAAAGRRSRFDDSSSLVAARWHPVSTLRLPNRSAPKSWHPPPLEFATALGPTTPEMAGPRRPARRSTPVRRWSSTSATSTASSDGSLQTLGFDREWVRGRGPYLIDSRGRGVPRPLRRLRRVRARAQPSVRQARSCMAARQPTRRACRSSASRRSPGVLAEELVGRAPEPIDAAVLHSSGTEAVEAALKLAARRPAAPGSSTASAASTASRYGSLSVNGNDEFRERFGPLLPGCDPVPFGDLDALRRELERGDVAGVHRRAGPGQGRVRRARRLPRGRAGAVPRGRRAADPRRGADRARPHRPVPGARALGRRSPTWSRCPRRCRAGIVPVGALLASRAVFDATFDSMERSVVHGSTFGGGDFAAGGGLASADGDRAGGPGGARGELGDLLHGADAPAGRALRDRARRPRRWG